MIRTRHLACVSISATAAFLAPTAGGQCVHEATLEAPDGATYLDDYGYPIATKDDVVVVGAHRHDEMPPDSGAAYVFWRQGAQWLEQKVLPNDLTGWMQYGNAVATDGMSVFVGSWLESDGSIYAGAVYVFELEGSTWVQSQKLVAADRSSGQFFGSSVAVSGDTLVIGARGDDTAGSNSGAAYVFHRAGSVWLQEAKLTPEDGAAGDLFGFTVSTDGDTALIGAPDADLNGLNSGAAYCYRREGSSWFLEAALGGDPGTPHAHFGHAVAVAGSMMLVGAPHDDAAPGMDSGSVFCYTLDGDNWTQQGNKMTAGDGAAWDEFGTSIALSGSKAIIGARGSDVDGPEKGATYVYGIDGLQLVGECMLPVPDDAPTYGHFGMAVAIDGSRVAAGGLGLACTFVIDDVEEGVFGDLNGDGGVDVLDLIALVTAWGDCTGCAADLDGSGVVDVLDLVAFISAWG